MDVVKTASNWARAEMISSALFAVIGVLFMLVSLSLWQLGRTDMARAFVLPGLVAGGLLVVLGVGLFIPAQTRLGAIPAAYGADPGAFLSAEIARADKVLNDYRIAAFRVFPAIIALCALLIPFVDAPAWRAALITAIAMFTVLIVIDGSANTRLQDYRQQLSAFDAAMRR